MSDSVKGMSNEELVAGLASKERELVTLRFAHSLSQLENTSKLRVVRKDIARLKTEARSREITGSLPKGSIAADSLGSVGGAESGGKSERGGFLKGIVDKLTTNE
jgi:large subunit ribosomal protein L29